MLERQVIDQTLRMTGDGKRALPITSGALTTYGY
jgi:hypothetical protein